MGNIVHIDIAFAVGIIVLHESLKIQSEIQSFLVPDLVGLPFVWNILILAKMKIS